MFNFPVNIFENYFEFWNKCWKILLFGLTALSEENLQLHLEETKFHGNEKILIMKMDEDEENYDEDVNKQSMTIPE